MTPVPSAKVKGDWVFRENEKLTKMYWIQTGAVSLCLAKNKKITEIANLGPGQVFGDNALLGTPTTTGALCTQDCKLIEISVDEVKAQIDVLSPPLKVLIKSLGERLRLASQEVKTAKLEKEPTPCPEDQVAKIFGALFHLFNHKGRKDPKNPNGPIELDWMLVKPYMQRVFGESPRRAEQVIQLLTKLKMAQMTMGKPPENPEGPDELQKVTILNMAGLEGFFEHYQFYFFKPSKGDILKYDEYLSNFVKTFLKCAEGLTEDRQGLVKIEYNKVLQTFKEDMNIDLKGDHYTRLEQKGVMLKRASLSDGKMELHFHLKELQQTQITWKILAEIEKWNEKGFVDMNEEANKKAAAKKHPAVQLAALKSRKQLNFARAVEISWVEFFGFFIRPEKCISFNIRNTNTLVGI